MSPKVMSPKALATKLRKRCVTTFGLGGQREKRMRWVSGARMRGLPDSTAMRDGERFYEFGPVIGESDGTFHFEVAEREKSGARTKCIWQGAVRVSPKLDVYFAPNAGAAARFSDVRPRRLSQRCDDAASAMLRR